MQQPVRTDHDVDRASTKVGQHGFRFTRILKARQLLDPDGPLRESIAECFEMLLCKQRRRNEYPDLITVVDGDKGRPHRYLRLAKAYVSANQTVHRLRSFLQQTRGDATRGGQVFNKICGQCHRIHGAGQDVGPDITSNGRGSFEQLLSNVFDPSLVIGAAYQASTVITADGRILTGLVAEDNSQRIVLKTLTWNTRALKCFERCGFTEYTRDTLAGYDFIFMDRSRQDWQAESPNAG